MNKNIINCIYKIMNKMFYAVKQLEKREEKKR